MNIFYEILSALEHEERIILATVISTSGSTPASALSKMLITNGGTRSVGTIGGGCMEGEVILHANRLYNSGMAEVLNFSLNEDDVESGLICGGSLDVLIEPVAGNLLPIFQKIVSLGDEGEDCVLGTILGKDKTVERKVIFKKSDGESDQWNVETYINCSTAHQLNNSITQLLNYPTPSLRQSISRAYQRNETVRLKSESGEIILEPIIGTPTLIIFGGGHISRFVSRSASMAGFSVAVVDDREKYVNTRRFPEADRIVVSDFTSAIAGLKISTSTYIVIVTRGHNFDERVLEHVIQTPAKYIGMIGSKRKVLTTYEHLIEHGVARDLLDRVHAPIGIDIGAVTAEEIGISIVAEMIRVRRGVNKPLRHMYEP